MDPNNVIQVSFNQPMNKTAVENGVRIQPATEVSYSWTGNNLVITPVHHLTGNTPYTVTIAQSAHPRRHGRRRDHPDQHHLRHRTDATGRAVAPPTLTLSTVALRDGVDGTGGTLLFAPDGSLVSTAGSAADSARHIAACHHANRRPRRPTATPEGVTDNAPRWQGNSSTTRRSGKPFALAAAASAAAFSPNGTYVAAAVDDGNGGSKIVVTLSDGSQQRRRSSSIRRPRSPR